MGVATALARLQAAVVERVAGKVRTRDKLLMLAQDNVVPPTESGFEVLGLVPRSVQDCVPFYLERYRAGGGRSGVFVPQR